LFLHLQAGKIQLGKKGKKEWQMPLGGLAAFRNYFIFYNKFYFRNFFFAIELVVVPFYSTLLEGAITSPLYW
jgi:hypothetical protein